MAGIIQSSLGRNSEDLQVLYQSPTVEIHLDDHELTFSRRADIPETGVFIGPRPRIGETIRVQLEDSRWSRIGEWMERHGVMSLKAPDQAGDPASIPAGKQYRLKVRRGEREHELAWTGASRWHHSDQEDQLRQAVQELQVLCEGWVQNRDSKARQPG